MAPTSLPQHWVRHWIRGKDVIQITVTLLDPETNEAIATVFSAMIADASDSLVAGCPHMASTSVTVFPLRRESPMSVAIPARIPLSAWAYVPAMVNRIWTT